MTNETQIEQINFSEIQELAYFKWEEAGCPESDGIEFWVIAERELTETNEDDSILTGNQTVTLKKGA